MPPHRVASLPSRRVSADYLATQALKRWESLSRFSSQNLSLMYTAEAMFCGAVARFGSTLLSINAVDALVVGPYGIFGGRFFWFCGSLTNCRNVSACALFGDPFMMTHESIV